jgi:hypothetical protein
MIICFVICIHVNLENHLSTGNNIVYLYTNLLFFLFCYRKSRCDVIVLKLMDTLYNILFNVNIACEWKYHDNSLTGKILVNVRVNNNFR